MFLPYSNSSLSSALILCLIMYHTLCQRTFYFEDQNIRFYQVTLVPDTGVSIIANQTPMGFTRPAQFIDNISNIQLALGGFSLQNQMNMEYDISVKYSSGQFNFILNVYNQTKFDYVSFFVILYTTKAVPYFQSRSLCLKCQILNINPNKNRTEQMNITMNTNRTMGSNYFVKAFIKSMKTRQGGNGYTRLQASYAYWDMFTTKLVVNLNTYESLVEEVCITVVALSAAVVGVNYTYLMNDWTIREFNAASLKALPTNFGIPSTIYGPIFNRKCLIGFNFLYFRDGLKQVFFDITKTGIQSITQNTPQYFYAQMTSYCVSRQRTCNNTQGIQTGLQECVNCSLMIKNCVFCLTEAECTACATGYYIDKAKKCCPSYLTNCLVCSQSNMCTQCFDGYYATDTGTCAQCSSPISNCLRCANSTFCFQCADGYVAVNFTSCKSTTSSSGTNATTTNSTTNSTTNQTSQTNQTDTNNTANSNTNNNGAVNPENNNTQSSGLSLWLILFVAVAGALALLLVVLIVVCFIWKKGKRAQETQVGKHMDPNENQNNELPQNNQLNNQANQQQVVTDMLDGRTSMQNNLVPTKITNDNPTQQLINQSQLHPGSGMQIRQGSKFNSYFMNYNNPKTLQNKSQIPTKDILNSTNQAKHKQSIQPESVITSQVIKPKEETKVKITNLPVEGPDTQRGLLKKDVGFLPQISKNSTKYGGIIRLKANYYK